MNQKGSSILSMLLFSPLAFAFLFLVVDGGLSFLEKAKITSAVSSSLSSIDFHEDSKHLLNYQNGFELNEESINNLILKIANDLNEKIALIKNRSEDKTKPNLKIEVYDIRLQINENNGSVENFVINQIVNPTGSSFSIKDNYPHYKNPNTYLENKLNSDGVIVSRFAVPIPSLNLENKYLNTSFLILVNIEAETGGLNREFAKKLLGRFYLLQELQLSAPRRLRG